MHNHCTRVKDLCLAEINVFNKHLSNHKWFRDIQDDTEAIQSMNEEYGVFLRDMFCRFTCPDRKDCEIMLEDLPPGSFDRIVVEQWDACKQELEIARKKIDQLDNLVKNLSSGCINSGSKPPDVSKELTSDLCIFTDEDGKRYCGYFHCNGYWYCYERHSGHTTVLYKKVISWEYLDRQTELIEELLKEDKNK